jgi:hypothetical protein
MRKIFILTLAVISVVSCGKFEEGPFLSFLSVKKRVEGKWKLDKYLMDGADSTESFLRGFSEEYDFKDDFTLVYTLRNRQPVDGKWVIEGNEILLELEMTSTNGIEYIERDTLPLVRLTNRQMWARYENGIEKQYKAD